MTSTTLSARSDGDELLSRETESARLVLADGPPPLPLWCVKRWLFVSQAPGPTLTPLAKSLNDSSGSSAASRTGAINRKVHWEVGAVVDVFVLLDSSVFQFTPDQVLEFMGPRLVERELQAPFSIARHMSNSSVPFLRAQIHSASATVHCVSPNGQRLFSNGHLPGDAKLWPLHKSRETYPFPIARGSPFPTQPEPLGGTTSCAEETGSHAGSSRRRDSDTERWTQGGLVELIRCDMFPWCIFRDTLVGARPRGTPANVCGDTEVRNLTTSTTSF